MDRNLIKQAIRRTSLYHIVLPLIVLAVAMSVYYMVNFESILRPTVANGSDEAYSVYSQNKDYAVVKIEKLMYTGFDVMDGNKTIGCYYYDVNAEGKSVFYLISPEMTKNKSNEIHNLEITVRFMKPNGIYQNMISGLAAEFNWTAEGMLENSVDVIYSQIDRHFYRYFFFYLFILGLIVYCTVYVISNLIYLAAPYAHPALRYIYATSVNSMGKEIEEVESSFENNVLFQAGDMYITDKYFINLGTREVSIIRLSRIIMGYEQGHLRNIFGFHMKMSSTLYFVGTYYRKIIASRKSSENVANVIEYMKEVYPDIIWGHTKENVAKCNEIKRERKQKAKIEKNTIQRI